MLTWLHPGLVHFAVALFFVALLFDFLALARASEKLLFAGYWNLLLGAGGAVLALLSGLLAASRLGPHDPLGDALLGVHRLVAFATTALVATLAALRVWMRGYIRPRLRTLYLSGALLCAALMLLTGALGGSLVYAYGLGISPEAARRIVRAQPPAFAPQTDAAPPSTAASLDEPKSP